MEVVDEFLGEEVMTEPADVLEPGAKWHGHQTWNCRLCTYNDTDMERALVHTEKVHGVFFGTQPVKTSLVGSSGEPLFMEVKHNGN